jgi:hypothetical protein
MSALSRTSLDNVNIPLRPLGRGRRNRAFSRSSQNAADLGLYAGVPDDEDEDGRTSTDEAPLIQKEVSTALCVDLANGRSIHHRNECLGGPHNHSPPGSTFVKVTMSHGTYTLDVVMGNAIQAMSSQTQNTIQ